MMEEEEDCDPVYSDRYGNPITGEKYEEISSELIDTANEVVLYGKLSDWRDFMDDVIDRLGCGAMTSDEAIAKLNELAGTQSVTYPHPVEDLSKALNGLPLNFITARLANDMIESITINPDGTVEGGYFDSYFPSSPEYVMETSSCSYTFRMTDITMADEYTIYFTVSDLKYAVEPGTETVIVNDDGTKTLDVAASTFSFKDGDRCVIYLTGAPRTEFDSGFLYYMERFISQDTGDLLVPAVYCPEAEEAFVLE